MKHKNNIFHPLDFIILSMLLIIAVFYVNTIWQYLSVIGIAYINLLLIARPIRYKSLTIFILYLLPILLALFLSSNLFAAHNQSLPKFDIARLLTVRYFTLAIISFAFALHTPFTQVFNYLVQQKVLPVKICYAMLAAFNSFYFLRNEFRRIQIAYKMRYYKNYISPLIFLALLTAAARYAHNLSISMYSRGINNHKTFVNKSSKLKYFDYMLYLVNFGVVAWLATMRL